MLHVQVRNLLALCALVVLAISCGGSTAEDASQDEVVSPASVTVYSGRNEKLVAPILERFTEVTGIETKVRYGGTSEMAATLLEEGANSPAALFFSQDAAALGALSSAGLLQPLPADLLSRVDPRFAAPAGDWVGISGRARSVVYNTERIKLEELPTTLSGVLDASHKGRFGVAPTNGSFQAHMAVYGVVNGQEALDELLSGIDANDPKPYPKNGAIVDAVLAGEVDWGLVNHYYLLRALAEDPSAPGANAFMRGEDGSGFINVAGVGLLQDTMEARALVEFLLGEEAQRYFAEETFEYPLAAGVAPSSELLPLSELATPGVDFGQVSAALEGTLEAIQKSGLLE